MHPVHQQLADSLSAGLFFVLEQLLCLLCSAPLVVVLPNQILVTNPNAMIDRLPHVCPISGPVNAAALHVSHLLYKIRGPLRIQVVQDDQCLLALQSHPGEILFETWRPLVHQQILIHPGIWLEHHVDAFVFVQIHLRAALIKLDGVCLPNIDKSRVRLCTFRTAPQVKSGHPVRQRTELLDGDPDRAFFIDSGALAAAKRDRDAVQVERFGTAVRTPGGIC
mmetsp:Transcript_26896/g.52971  ORF Transcript_26896/g.52971 Transcript_26896/m.52971 type:complete len:222 (-) Transcript_26896:592-1257(-)